MREGQSAATGLIKKFEFCGEREGMKNMFLLIDGVIQCPIPSRMKMGLLF